VYVRENPLRAVVTALAAGFLIGLLIRKKLTRAGFHAGTTEYGLVARAFSATRWSFLARRWGMPRLVLRSRRSRDARRQGIT
jgi:hypothetical protein